MKEINNQWVPSKKTEQGNGALWPFFGKMKLSFPIFIYHISQSNTKKGDAKPGEEGKIINSWKTIGDETKSKTPRKINSSLTDYPAKYDDHYSKHYVFFHVFKKGIADQKCYSDEMKNAKNDESIRDEHIGDKGDDQT